MEQDGAGGRLFGSIALVLAALLVMNGVAASIGSDDLGAAGRAWVLGGNLLLVAILTYWGVTTRRDGTSALRARRGGLRGSAEITALRVAGGDDHDTLHISAVLTVPNREPRSIAFAERVPDGVAPRLRVGAVLPVLVDPRRDTCVFIDWVSCPDFADLGAARSLRDGSTLWAWRRAG
jgi:hypothetical protein